MDFNIQYDPRRGDLLYGLKMPRAVLQGMWAEHWRSIANDPHHLESAPARDRLNAGALYICDRFNNHFDLAVPSTYSSKEKIEDKFKTYDTTTVAKKPTSPDQQGRLGAYADGLVASRFSPKGVIDESTEKLKREGASKEHFGKKRKWFDVVAGRKKELSRERRSLTVNMTQLAIRRACKFGIGLVAEDAAFSEAKTHFILDGLDMRAVAMKSERDGDWLLEQGKRPSVSITTSELRYVYRNWGKLSSKTLLYVHGDIVDAPWITNWGPRNTVDANFKTISAEKALWDQYGVDRGGKYAGAIPDKSLV